MAIVNVSHKGQVVIPVDLRRRFGIEPNGKVEVTELNNEIVVIPLPKDPIKEGRGFLKLKEPVAEIMKRTRAEEERLEER
jgi:AbrB family looped-hinge helix DNA binding protein